MLNVRKILVSHPTKKESLMLSLIWILCIGRIAWPKGLDSAIGNLDILSVSTPRQIQTAFGLGDAGNLLDVAITWSNFKSLSPVDQHWIVRLWSPGLPILEIPLIWLDHLGVPLFWSFTSALLLLWGLAFYLAWTYLSPVVGRFPLLIFASLLVLSWDFQFMFQEGVFYTEGFSYIFLLYSLFQISYLAIVGEIRNQKHLATFAGVCLGISIWLRHTLDVYIFIIALISISIFYAKRRIGLIKDLREEKSSSLLVLKNSSIDRILIRYSVAAMITTLPWRILATFYFHGAPLQMSSGGNLFGSRIWASPESEVGEYWDSYGVNWACKIDTDACLDLQEKLDGSVSSVYLIMKGIQSAVENPVPYLQIRFKYMIQNWIPGFGDSINIANIIGFLSILAILLLSLLIALGKNENKILILLIWTPLLFIQILQFMIIHYEPRYFISMRLTIFSLILFLISQKSNQKIVRIIEKH
jgi:hypothetical protein